MPVRIFRITVTLAFLICLLTSQFAFAKKVYRLEDEEGKTLYSDQIEPEQAKYRRELLSSNGRVIEVTEKAKTKEQQLLENQLKALRKEQEKLIVNQNIRDNALLSTYHSKEEIFTALKLKMLAFDSQIAALEGNLKNVTEQLKTQQKLAANYERNEQKVPQKVLDDIKATQIQIEEVNKAIVSKTDKKALAKDELNADISRFLFLTQSVKKPEKSTTIPSIKEANALGLFYCENDHQCNKAWEIARNFVNLHSTTQVDIYNDKLIMNRPPAKDSDISLSLSRIAISNNEYELFLDIHCHDSQPGHDLCASQKIRDIRSSFRPYVNDGLSRSTE
ncbi:MAG: hypothetical protein ACXW0Q_06375 [Methylovulum sp.]